MPVAAVVCDHDPRLSPQLPAEAGADTKPAVQLPGVLERALNYKIERAKEVGVELSELERIGQWWTGTGLW